uniref:TetR/AcrR family transcriptional regulator n=1 Tax=Mucilaginibacter sp. Bleaf8 TaxID=2834430 RepID=UPI0020BE658C|nr:TetR/AcrR family transcriptional regulator [Mucilaginibacter sp. Bleaf8]
MNNMVRKVTNGPLRSKERTKANIVKAIGKILKKDGFSGINAAKVASVANVDRKLIYDYFGSLSGLIKYYLESHDYWEISPENIEGSVENGRIDNGKALAYNVLEHQFDSLIENEEMRRVITWGISEKLPALKDLDLRRENTGDEILKALFDPHFEGTGKNFRAMYGILMAGVYYLTLHAKMQENPFCGINLQEASGQQEIKKALKQILDLIYQ